MSNFLFLILFLSLLSISRGIKKKCNFTVEATAQTPKVLDNLNTRSPDCDDAAVIINSNKKSDSLVVGTLKEGGLQLYALNGTLLQSIPAPDPPNNDNNNAGGRFNNVDVINSIKTPSKQIVIVSDRGLDQLRFYILDGDNRLKDVTDPSVPWVFSTSQTIVNKQETVYGLTATNYGNKMTVFGSKRHQGIVAKINVIENATSDWLTYEVVETLTLPVIHAFNWTACMEDDGETPQVEGMVVDDKDGTFLIAQETVGLYTTTVKGFANATKLELIDVVTTFGVEYERVYDVAEQEYVCTYNGTDNGVGGNIIADAEGLSLYKYDTESKHGGFYVLSNQGAHRFGVYSRKTPFNYLGSFNIKFGTEYVRKTDGVDIRNDNFGTNYPKGILIVQSEGPNDDTNFKFVNFQNVLDKFKGTDCVELDTSKGHMFEMNTFFVILSVFYLFSL